MRRNISSSASHANQAVAAKGCGTAAAASSGSLASILLNNRDTAKYMQPNAPKLLKHYRKIEPNDYWKYMKEWDFLSDLNDKMGGQNAGNGKRKRGNDDKNSNKGISNKPLPDTFESYREYCALWSPLCLEEARAQLLSGVIADIPYMRSKPDKSPIRVRLEPLKKDVNGSSESMGVQVKDILTPNFKDRAFIANDVVLLVKKESYFWEASKGTLEQQQRTPVKFGLVGHIEYTRRSTEGLFIHVSRALWSEVGSSEMVLLKLGCNITSLREFTALCRMDSIPLLQYIMGSKMSSRKPAPLLKESAAAKDDEDIDQSLKENRAKKEILSNMGGPTALGKGFAEYASHKFNLSQLEAISASAQEYGDGGFTLIKGPPGTGKVSLCVFLSLG